MKIELRKIEYFERGSEETSCYAAKVYVDGKHVADVSNDGHGGCDYQHPAKGFNHAYLVELEKRIAAEFPAPFEIEGKPVPADLESVCGDLLTEALIAKDLKRSLGRQLLFVTKDKPGVRCLSLSQRGKKFPVETVAAHIRGKYPDATILNTLPLPEALAIYRKDGAA